MIRLTFRIVTLMLCVVALAGLARLANSTWVEFGAMRSEGGVRLDQTDLSLIYEVSRFQWLEFPAPGAQRVVRVMAHADVPEGELAQPDRIFQFLIQVRFVDAGGVVLGERNMRFRTRGVQYRDLDTGELYRRAFYPGGGPQPTSTQETRLSLPSAEVHSIRFQLAEADPDISAVQLRMYKQEPPPAHRLEKAWDRLSGRTRGMLASGNLYPIEFLTTREKVNLVRNRWKPAGPRGVEGADYRVRDMRVFRSRSGELVGGVQAGNGEYVAHWLNLPIQIPESGRLRIAFTPAADNGSHVSDSNLQLVGTWYGESMTETAAFQIPIAEDGSATLDVEQGLLDLQFSRPGYVRAHLRSSAKLEQELNLERLGVRKYFLDPQAPMTFPVRHAGAEGTTLRIDLACQCFGAKDGTSSSTPTARYLVRGTDGTVLSEGEIENPRFPSRYAYVRLAESTPITEGSRYMMHLPQQAASLELFGETQLMASVFSRPRDMPRRVLVSEPDDAQGTDSIRRLWFPLRPADYEAVRNSARSSMVFRGVEPPDPDLERRLNESQWERFEPEGDWVGRYLLEPREAEAQFTTRALSSVFRQIQPNQDIKLRVQGTGIESSVPMRLVVRRTSSRSLPVRIWVDGRLRWRGRVSGENGELAIGRVPIGMHTLRVEVSEPAEVMVNYTDPGDSGFSKRLAIRVRKPVLEIPFRKRSRDREVLSGIVYFPASVDGEMHIRADILGSDAPALRMFESSTVPASELDVVGSAGPAVAVLNATDAPVLTAQRFYLPLGEDLPAGAYRIRLEFSSTSNTYLILSRTTPGSAATRFLRHESLTAEDET